MNKELNQDFLEIEVSDNSQNPLLNNEEMFNDEMPKPKEIKKEEKTSTIISFKGTYSEDIIEKIKNTKSRGEKLNEVFQKLANAKRNKSILWGTLVKIGTEIIGDKELAFAYVDFNGIEVKIAADLYFEPSYDFGNTYKEASFKEKEKRKLINLKYQLGAIVCFIPISLRRDILEGDEQESIICMGDRLQAMKVLRKIYFFGENGPLVKPNDIIEDCHILAVKDMSILVECCGVETRVMMYYISYKQAEVDSATELYMPGDIVKGKVRSLSLMGEEVKLSITFRTEEAESLIKKMKRNQIVLGVVDSYNSEKGTYTIVTKDGIKCAVKKENVQGKVSLSVGDRVSFIVTNIYPSHLAGICKKL